MKEIYNFFEYGPPKYFGNVFVIIFAFLFAIFFIVGILKLISLFACKNSKVGFFNIFPCVVSILLLPIFIICQVFFYSNNTKLYDKCVDSFNRNQYITLTGEIENLSYLKRDNELEYNIVFELNNVIFDDTSFAYQDATFTSNDIHLLENLKQVTVKYIEYEGSNVIISISANINQGTVL